MVPDFLPTRPPNPAALRKNRLTHSPESASNRRQIALIALGNPHKRSRFHDAANIRQSLIDQRQMLPEATCCSRRATPFCCPDAAYQTNLVPFSDTPRRPIPLPTRGIPNEPSPIFGHSRRPIPL